MRIFIILTLFLISASTFAYDLTCDGTRLLGFKSYDVLIKNIDTRFKKRSGELLISSKNKKIYQGKISVVADYLDGDSFLTLETKSLSVYGYIAANKGELEVEGKKYSLSNCR